MSPSSPGYRSVNDGEGNAMSRDSLVAEVEWLAQRLDCLEHRVQQLEDSLFFRFLRATGRVARVLKHKVLLTGPAAIRAA